MREESAPIEGAAGGPAPPHQNGLADAADLHALLRALQGMRMGDF